MALTKNSVIELEITGYTSEGSGVGHYEGQAVFVAGAAEGDIIECLIIKAKKTYAIGKIKSIIKASQDRIIPDCVVFPRCGGCVFRHLSYDAEKKLKLKRIEDAFTRLGGLDKYPTEILSAGEYNYRNKAQYPVSMTNGRMNCGFYAPFSHRVIDCKNCLLQPTEFAGIIKTVSKWCEKYKIPVYDEETKKGLLRHIYIRKGFVTNQIMVCLVVNGDRVFKTKELCESLRTECPEIKTILLNHNTEDTNVVLGQKNTVLYGKGRIEDVLCGKRFRISPLSFYQVNHDGAELLYGKVKDYIQSACAKNVLDLYCGAGTIGLTLSDITETLTGVEIVPEAIEDAKFNAELNNIKNARFICADAAEAALLLKNEGLCPDALIVDPPRKGCSPELLETINSFSAETVVYVSCDPATLARDLKILQTYGYVIRESCAVDMFPRTAHVETIVKLTK